MFACTLASCTSPSEVSYAISTQSRMVCCRTMNFTVAEFPGATKSSSTGSGVSVLFPNERMSGDCTNGAETSLVIANHTGEEILIPTSRELEGSKIKLYPWRLHHDSTRGHIRLARQIQFGDMFERPDGRLRFLRLADGYEARLTAWVPGPWLCTKPTELYEGYLTAELDPSFYSQRARGIRTSPLDQAKDLVSPIGMQYDVVWATLDFLDVLPVLNRTSSAKGDTITMLLDVKEEPAAHLIAAQRVASSNIIEMSIDR